MAVQGLATFTWTGDAIVAKVLAAQERAAERTAQWAVELARELCPVDTGYLRSTIGYEVRRTAGGFAIVVFAGAEYALYVILGTSRVAAQDFMRPVLDRIGPIHQQFLAEEMQRGA